jgi:hypothetical protein
MCQDLDLGSLLFYYLFCQIFFFLFAHFHFLWLSVFLPFPPFLIGFLSPFVSPLLFHPCFVSVFLLMWVSSLAYPNLLGTKRLGWCCCCRYFHWSWIVCWMLFWHNQTKHMTFCLDADRGTILAVICKMLAENACLYNICVAHSCCLVNLILFAFKHNQTEKIN